MSGVQLPRTAAALVDWNAVQEGLSVYSGFHAGAENEQPTADKTIPSRADIERAFTRARTALGKGAEENKKWKQRWLWLGILAAFLAVGGTIASAALSSNWSWAGVGGALLGQGGVVACCFQFLNYLRGEEAITRFLANAEAAFSLCRDDRQYDMVMGWFIDQTTKMQ